MSFTHYVKVVVTAGSIMTSKLLMNSGIGSREELQEAGVEVKVPVLDSCRSISPYLYIYMSSYE